MSPADVSVVIAAYNAADAVGHAIRSALSQENVAIEVVVVDDRSSDDTVTAVRAVGDPRVRVMEMPANGGPAAARNAGFAAATADWIAVLDSDDVMQQGRLARLLERARRTNADLVIDNVRVEENGRPDRIMFAPSAFAALGPCLGLATFVKGNHPLGSTFTLGYSKPLFRRAFLEAHGLSYDATLRVGEDYLLVADALALGATCAVERQVGYVYRRRAGSISNRLTGQHVAAMIAADDAFAGRYSLDPATVAAIADRRAALRDVAAFTDAVEALKARRMGAALAAIARRPTAAIHFRLPIAARIERLRPGGLRRRDGSSPAVSDR